MKVKFDALNRLEVPKLFVCSPGSVYINGHLTNMVGCLYNTSDEELVMNFNAESELNFRAYRVLRDDPEENAYAMRLYRSLQNRRLIFVEDVGYFVIEQVEDGFEGGISFKDVRAVSCEREIANKLVPYIANGTYRFIDLLNKLVSVLPLWEIGYIDGVVSDKYRTFEDVSEESNIQAFMLEDMQDAYECIFIFDCIERKINVYDQSSYVVETNIHLTKNDLINSINITESGDDLYTAISVLGDEDLNIVSVNPLGTNVIYNFEYYLSWMTPSLSAKVQTWHELVRGYQDEYGRRYLNYLKYLSERNTYQAEVDKINTQITMYLRLGENIIAENSTINVASYNKTIEANGGKSVSIEKDIEATLIEIDGLISVAMEELTVAQKGLEDSEVHMDEEMSYIDAIHNEVAIKKYFTEAEYGELYNYIYEGNYRDEYISVTDSMDYKERYEQMQTLYERAVDQLSKASQPSYEFSIDTENFLFTKVFQVWSEQLETGCLINVELDVNDIAQLFLSSMVVNYDDKTLKLTFGNRFIKFDPKALFNDFLGDVKKSSNSINYIKDILSPLKNGELDDIRDLIHASRTLTLDDVLASENEDVIIDGTGYTGRRKLGTGEFDDKQVKIVANAMVFTSDGWKSCKIALGEIPTPIFDSTTNEITGWTTSYGLNAETLIGDLILGRQLRIGNTTIDENGDTVFHELFTVVDGRVQANVDSTGKNSGNNFSWSLTSEGGFVVKADDTVIFSVDTDGVYMIGDITSGGDRKMEITSRGLAGRIGGWLAKDHIELTDQLGSVAYSGGALYSDEDSLELSNGVITHLTPLGVFLTDAKSGKPNTVTASASWEDILKASASASVDEIGELSATIQ